MAGIQESPSLSVMQARCTEKVGGVAERYADLARRGYHGSQFQPVSQVWRSAAQDEVLATVQLPEDFERYYGHPALLDGVFQLVGFIRTGTHKVTGGGNVLPSHIELIHMRASIGREGSAVSAQHVWAHGHAAQDAGMDMTILQPSGVVIMSLKGVRFEALEPRPAATALNEVHWPEIPLPAMYLVSGNSI